MKRHFTKIETQLSYYKNLTYFEKMIHLIRTQGNADQDNNPLLFYPH